MSHILKAYNLTVKVGAEYRWDFGVIKDHTGKATGRYIQCESDHNIADGYPCGTRFGYMQNPGESFVGKLFTVTHVDRTNDLVTIQYKDEPSTLTPVSQEINMNGSVYEAVVVQTRKVSAGEGVACASVDKSTIVFQTKAPFVSKDDATATGVVYAQAIAAGIEIDDVTAPVEVKLRKF